MPWTFYNSNGQRLSTATTLIDNLDIDGATDIGADIADADLFIIDDNASGTNRKTAASRLKTYAGTTQAVQSDIEGETNQDTYVPPDLIKHSPGVAKAWLKLTGSDGATQKSYNSTSTARNGAGSYTWTIANDLSATDYVVVGSVEGNADRTNHPVITAATTVLIYTRLNGTLTDLSSSTVVFGDL